MSFSQIKTSIMLDGYNNQELNELAECIKYARAQLTKQVKRSLNIGDLVKFSDSRHGVVHQGSVVKINVKYVIVSTPRGNYRVPANMLDAV